MIIGYTRVSTIEQNNARQIESIGEVEKCFDDKCSGSTTNRPALTALLSHVREGDSIKVHSIDRMARNLVDLRSLITDLNEQGITVEFIKEGLTFKAGATDKMSSLLLNMIGAVAEFELSMIKERQMEGIAAYKAEHGEWAGKKVNETKRDKAKELRDQGMSQRKIAAQLECSLSSVVRYLKM